MKVSRAGVAIALVAAMIATQTPTTRAWGMAKTDKCKEVTVCKKGGVEGNMCTISDGGCPPCVTFENSGCFELTAGKCNFGVDCTPVWDGGDTKPSGSGSGAKNSGSKGGNGHVKPSQSPGSKGNNGNDSAGNPSNGTSSNNSTSTSPSADSKTKKDSSGGGSQMSVVFGIIGAAIGVIAVAVIFLALVRRSRAAHDDDDESMTPTPQAVAKNNGGLSTTTNAAGTYAPYAQRAGGNPMTPTNNVIKYYNDNAQPSPHHGRNGAGGGGFGQAAPVATTAKTVRPAAAASAPTFFKQPGAIPAASAAPVGAQLPVATAYVPQQPPQQQPTQYASQPPSQAPPPQAYASQQPQQTYAAGPTAEPLFTVHTGPQEPPVQRRTSSPRPRRESYEF